MDRSRVLSAACIAFLAAAPALALPPEQGHWDVLGEDGRVWVPAEPPHAAYLPPSDLGAYRNASEAAAALQALAAARPDLIAVSTLGASVQGRPLLLASVTGPGDATGRTRVLFDGAHHGDEVISSEILVRYLEDIAAQYDTNATLRALLGTVILDVVPMVNPDGVARTSSCSNYADCRKNSHGVDLNRNYADHWNGPGSSSDPGSATYRGPSALSEPESRAIATLLDQHDYALYASLHSGAELILWPVGWTTAPPAEAAVFQQLGNELTAITGVPNGQVSQILYSVSGDAMDQAYGSAAGWHSVPISPETYEGSGSAFDWWLLFNPPETEASIAPVVAKWKPFLGHLLAQAANYAPARLGAPDTLVLGPDAGALPFSVTAASRRPLLGASVAFDALGAPARAVSSNPVPLANASGLQSGVFSLEVQQGGAFNSAVRLNGGQQGMVQRTVALQLSQVALSLGLAQNVLASPDPARATLAIEAGPFDRAAGQLVLRVLPEGRVVSQTDFDARPGVPFAASFDFSVADLLGGNHTLEAVANFTADLGGQLRPGLARAAVPFTVLRPQMALDKRFAASSAAGQPLPILAIFRNTGTYAANDLVVRETVPAGYAYWFRDGPVPVPLDPLGKPVPDAVEARGDGGVDLVYHLGAVAPGAQRVVQYRVVAIAPGTHVLPSTWEYDGAFASGSVHYREESRPAHNVRTT